MLRKKNFFGLALKQLAENQLKTQPTLSSISFNTCKVFCFIAYGVRHQRSLLRYGHQGRGKGQQINAPHMPP